MARYTQAEFAKECGVPNAFISTYKNRGKIILSDDGFIHDTVRENADFLRVYREKKAAGSIKVGTPAEDIPDQNNKKASAVSGSSGRKYDLDLEKKQLEIEKLKVDTRLQELKEEKIRGEIVPIALAKPVFQMFHQAIMTSQKEGIEILLIETAKECRMSGEQLAKMRGKLKQILNDCSKKAIAIATKDLKTIVEEYSIKKEVGEHE